MSKRIVRLIVAGSMVVTLFLRWNPSSDPEGYSNLLFILWSSLEASSMMVAEPTIASIVSWSGFVLFLQAIPLLTLFNVWLFFHPSKRLQRFCRLLLVILLPLTWYETLTFDPGWRGIGFWAHTAMITVAALIEVILLVKERLQNHENVGSRIARR
jgi:hypothetical protein